MILSNDSNDVKESLPPSKEIWPFFGTIFALEWMIVGKSCGKINLEKGTMESNRVVAKLLRPTKRTLLWLFLLTAPGIFFMLPPASEGVAGEMVLLHTNNVTGHLFPCPT